MQIPGTDCVINVTRSGKAVTLINLSLSELETVFIVFNELFYVMSIPSLHKFLLNPQTGKLKEVMSFIVDNQPSESIPIKFSRANVACEKKKISQPRQGKLKGFCRISKRKELCRKGSRH